MQHRNNLLDENDKENHNIKDDAKLVDQKQKIQDANNTLIKHFIDLANAGNVYARKYIKPEHSSTNTSITEKPILFALRDKIKEIRSIKPSFDEAFFYFLLTSTSAYAIFIRFSAKLSQHFGFGNCAELTELAMKFLRRYDVTLTQLSIVNGDHTILKMGDPKSDTSVILDTLDQKFYPSSEIYQHLDCYHFDENKDNPHVVTRFTSENQLQRRGSIKCFINPGYNQEIVKQFYNKLNIILKSFSKHSSGIEATKNLEEMINSYKNEVESFDDIKTWTNLKIERMLDRKIKDLTNFIKKHIEDKIINKKDDFFYDVIINMQSIYPSPTLYYYFKHLIYLEPLFSSLINYLNIHKNDQNNELLMFFKDANNKQLLNQLLHKTVIIKNPILEKSKIINILLNYGADPSMNFNGATLLMWAIKDKDKTMVMRLIKHTKLFRLSDKYGNLPLHLAIKEGSPDLVNLILQYHPYLVNDQDKHGCTPLYIASQRGYSDLVFKLLKDGANPEIATYQNKFSPLHLAVKINHIPIVKLILTHHPHLVNHQAYDDFTPLHLASEHGWLALVCVLLNRKANPMMITKQGQLLSVHLAAIKGHGDVVKLILDKYPNLINKKDANGDTLLQHAIKSGHDFLVNDLLNRGADTTGTPELLTNFKPN